MIETLVIYGVCIGITLGATLTGYIIYKGYRYIIIAKNQFPMERLNSMTIERLNSLISIGTSSIRSIKDE